jgi:hypothetical protein
MNVEYCQIDVSETKNAPERETMPSETEIKERVEIPNEIISSESPSDDRLSLQMNCFAMIWIGVHAALFLLAMLTDGLNEKIKIWTIFVCNGEQLLILLYTLTNSVPYFEYVLFTIYYLELGVSLIFWIIYGNGHIISDLLLILSTIKMLVISKTVIPRLTWLPGQRYIRVFCDSIGTWI